MKTYDTLEKLPLKKRMIALGNFDGVHLGHRPIILQAVKMAHESEAEAAVFLFDPHPMELLLPGQAYPLLTTPLQRGVLLEELGVECLILVKFNDQMMHMSPSDFINKLLIESCGAIGISVGYDYSFGYKGVGDVALLKKLTEKANIALEIQPVINYLGERVSSTRIKQAIQSGNIWLANRLLGRTYQVNVKLSQASGGCYHVEYWPNAIYPLQGMHSVKICAGKSSKDLFGQVQIQKSGETHFYSQDCPLSDHWLTMSFLSVSP